MKSQIGTLVILAFTLFIHACTSAKLPPTTSYTITTPALMQKSAASDANRIIRIAMPTSTAAIMSRNILYQEDDYSLNAYSFSKWSDTPNRMIANLILNRLAGSQLFRAVLPADSRGKSDYVLETTIQQFYQQIEADRSSRAVIHIACYLIDARGKVIATREFNSTHKAPATNAAGAVSALNQGVVAISNDLMDWLAGLKL